MESQVIQKFFLQEARRSKGLNMIAKIIYALGTRKLGCH